jgi:hypothetical protein
MSSDGEEDFLYVDDGLRDLVCWAFLCRSHLGALTLTEKFGEVLSGE